MARKGVKSRRVVFLALGPVLVLVCAAAGAGVWWGLAPRLGPFKEGLAAYHRGDFAAAERKARARLKQDPDDLLAVRLLVRSLYRQGHDPQANSFRMRIPEPLWEAEDFYLLGMAYVRQGDPQGAILMWRRALGRDPRHLETLTALEGAMMRLDLLKEAERAARSLAEVPGHRSRGHFLLARSLEEQGDYAGARDALAIALENPPEWKDLAELTTVLGRYARMLLRTAMPAKAREVIQAIPTDKRAGEISWLLARCDLAEGRASDPALAAASRSYREAHPALQEPAPYIGETQCLKCHAEIYQTQHGSRHARTFPRKEQLAAIPFPRQPIPDPSNSQVGHSYLVDSRGIVEETRLGDKVWKTVVDYAFGSGDRGLTLVGHDENGKYYEMRMSYYAPPTGWDVTSGHPQGVGLPDSFYRGMSLTLDAVRRCLFCHATHPQAVLTQTGPEAQDRAIGCEHCHGPGGHHLLAVKRNDPDLALARFTQASGPEVLALCARCHSPRSKDLKLSPGSPDSVRFQGTTLTWSRCYAESQGMLDCVTCHNPHKNVDEDHKFYDSRCLQCHGMNQSLAAAHRTRPDSAPAAQSCPVEPAGDCVSCHMPKVRTTMSHAEFTDHFIRAHPREPALGQRTHGPNETAKTVAVHRP